ncbi:hydrolase [Parapedomonas caeni]
MLSITREEARPLDWIAERQAAMTETVMAWSAINSGSRNLAGLDRMATALEQAFGALGPVRLVAPEPVSAPDNDGCLQPLPHGRIFHLTVRPEARHRVLLAGHMDTVFAADHPFQAPRWREPGVLNGPGVADMKGGLLVMLHALLALEQSPWAGGLGYEVVINADEEVSSLGSAALLAAAARRADIGLVYEPALPDGRLAGARKGIGTYAVLAQGRAAHAGRNPEAGRNAVLAVADLFVRLARLPRVRDGLTVNVASLGGGGPTNVVPAQAVGRFEVRCWSHEDRHWAQAQVAAIVAEVAGHHDVSLTVHGGFNRPPKPLDAVQAGLFEAVRGCGADLGLAVDWAPSGGCCDGNNLAAQGLPVVDSLGVRGGAIHSAEEFLIVDSMTERARLSALLLMRLASGALAWPARGPRP